MFNETDLQARLGSKVDLTVAPDDEMFFGEMRRYLRAGYSGLRWLQLSLAAAGAGAPRSILDLPSGHGRLMRLLRVEYPNAEIWAADLNRSAVDFCAKQFGAVPIYSDPDPAAIPIQRRFDLLWSGSLLTHLSAERCMEFLAFFRDRLEPGGVAVFSTHGARPAEWLRIDQFNYGLEPDRAARVLDQYRSSGFGYSDYSTATGYGVSLTSPGWVVDAIERTGGWRLAAFFPTAWDDHHDVWACVRD